MSLLRASNKSDSEGEGHSPARNSKEEDSGAEEEGSGDERRSERSDGGSPQHSRSGSGSEDEER